MKNILFTLCSFALLACSSGEKKAIELKKQELSTIINSQFTIPDSLDFKDYNLADKPINLRTRYKIVSLIDSSDCTVCNLSLKSWHLMMSYLQTEDVSFIFASHEKDAKALSDIMYLEQFTYPFCFGGYTKIIEANKKIIDCGYSTFLLDENNKVISVGDPSKNKRFRELYFKLVSNNVKSVE